MLSVGNTKACPTLVHGCSGTRRTGAYVIMSMLCKQLRECGVVSVIAACSMIRKYCYDVMRNCVNFATVLEVILYFAAELGMVDRQSRNFATAIKRIKASFPLPANKVSTADAMDVDETAFDFSEKKLIRNLKFFFDFLGFFCEKTLDFV